MARGIPQVIPGGCTCLIQLVVVGGRGQAALAARWVHNAITQEGGVGEAASEPHRIKFLVALEQDGVCSAIQKVANL